MMKLKKAFFFFITIFLFATGSAIAQKKHKHKTVDTTEYILPPMLVWLTFDLTNANSNAALLCLYDTMGNKMNFNQVIAKELKNHTVKAYGISHNFNDLKNAAVRIDDDSDGFDTWVYDDADDKQHTKDSSLKVKHIGWQKMDEINDPSADTSDKYFTLEYLTYHGDTGRTTETIQWIGPCGKDDKGRLKPLFAIKYEDLALLLDDYTLWQYCKEGTSYSCHDFIRCRRFSSRIIKVVTP